MLYSYKGQEPAPLPERIRLSDGSTRTDSTTFTEEEIADAGYVVAGAKPNTSKVGNVFVWNNDNWEERGPTISEINAQWKKVREKRDFLLAEADVMLMLSIERNITDIHVGDYKQNLRDVPQYMNDPFDIVYPIYGETMEVWLDRAENGITRPDYQEAQSDSSE